MKAFLLAWVIVTGTLAAGAQEYLNCHLAPGWEQTGPKRDYTADNLYDYKDGGAEGYLVFGFVRMQGIDCKNGAATVSIDASEMGDAELAYGMFAANRDANLAIAKIGMGGQVQPQSLSFARGKFYVELVVSGVAPKDDYSATLAAFAKEMNARLPGQDTPPEPLSWFPRENLTDVRLVPESVLGLRLLKRGYVAQYAQGQAFVVEEANAESAVEVLQKLRERFAVTTPVHLGDEGFQAQVPYLDGICVFRKGKFLAGYANLAQAAEAAALAAKLVAKIPGN